MSRGETTAPTAAAPRAPTSVYYDYEEPVRSRPVWPWIIALLLVAGALVAGWAVYNQIQAQLNEARPVAVPDLRGLREPQAVTQVLEAGLEPDVRRQPRAGTEPTFVFDQTPKPFERIEKGNSVTILVSTGPPKVQVPDVRGRSDTEAVAALARLGLEAKINEIFSDEDPGIVTGQKPRPGQVIVVGSKVTLNVSKGRQPIAVPVVIGQPYDTAASRLQGAGFAVARQDVDSDQPAGIVVDQDPDGNTLAAPGAKVTLSVSKGPEETTVPDVTSQDEETARETLEDSGFRVRVARQTTDNPDQDGFVLSQTPAGGTRAQPGSTVTITVGRFEEPPPATAAMSKRIRVAVVMGGRVAFPRASFFLCTRVGPRAAVDGGGRARAEEQDRGNLPAPSFTLHAARRR
jgi:beta-lactam-binding protein with PASTA domain